MSKKKPASNPIRILRSATAEDWTRIADKIVEINRPVGSEWLVSNGFPDDLDRAVKIAVAELGDFATSQDVGEFPMDNIRELLQTCVDRRQWLTKISKPDADRTQKKKPPKDIRASKNDIRKFDFYEKAREKSPHVTHGEVANHWNRQFKNEEQTEQGMRQAVNRGKKFKDWQRDNS